MKLTLEVHVCKLCKMMFGSQTWPMRLEREVNLDTNKIGDGVKYCMSMKTE